MKIETKFNVGDKLWRILDDNTGVASFVVKNITAYYMKNFVTEKYELTVYYNYGGYFKDAKESDVFETLEQAQIEYERRNNAK